MKKRGAWVLGAAGLFFGVSLLGGCDAVLGLGSLKDGPAPDGSTPANDAGQTEDGGQPDGTLNDGKSVPDGNAGPDSTGPDGGPGADADAADAGEDAQDGGLVDAADANACVGACTVGLTQCDDGGVETCEAAEGACPAWVQTTRCGPHQTCGIVADAGAVCNCVATPCQQNGTVCESAQTEATCATDSNGCLYVSATTPCSSPQSCSGSAPTAACSLTCSNSCNQGDTTCVSGQLATCTLGSNGCWAYGPAAPCKSSYASCTGPAGSAQCTCNTDPICQGASNYCANSSSSVVSCAQDAQNCWYESATQPCTGGACTGTAGSASCCTNMCTAGTYQCAPGGIQTCIVVNGCTAWSTAQACPSTYQSCTGASGSAQCTCNTDPVCQGAAAYCTNSSTEKVTCAQDAQKCWYESSTVPCETGQACNPADTNCESGCYISGEYYASGDVNQAAPGGNAYCESCQPGTSTTAWSAEADGTGCTGHVNDQSVSYLCSAGSCKPDCDIGGTLYYESDVNPANHCQLCWPAATNTAWSACSAAGLICSDLGGQGDSCI